MGEPMGPPGAVQQAAMEQPRRGPRRWTWLAVVAGVVVVGVVAGGFVLLQNVRSGYYIGEQNGRVVLFRGTTQEVPGISLSRKEDRQPSPAIMVADLPQDLQEQVRGTYTVDGPQAWKRLENAVCKYSLVDNNGKIVVVKGQGQENCGRATTVKKTNIPVRELPDSDAAELGKGSMVFVGQAGAEQKLQELTARRDQCKTRNSDIPDCPSSGGKS